MEDLNLVDILIYFINFFVTFLLLYLLLYKPISSFLGGRRERVEQALREAGEKRSEADRILAEAKAELANIDETSKQLAHETIENAALAAEKITDNAEEKAAAMIARVREQMEAERQMALERAFTDLVSFAGALASRVIAREVNVDDNRAIVERFFEEHNVEVKPGDLMRVAATSSDGSANGEVGGA